MTNECERCSLPLHGYSEASDCRICDPLCPVFGTHGELWDGDEETSRAAYEDQTMKITKTSITFDTTLVTSHALQALADATRAARDLENGVSAGRWTALDNLTTALVGVATTAAVREAEEDRTASVAVADDHATAPTTPAPSRG